MFTITEDSHVTRGNKVDFRRPEGTIRAIPQSVSSSLRR